MRTQKIVLIMMSVIIAVSLVACSGENRQSSTASSASDSLAQSESSQQANTTAAPSSEPLSAPSANSTAQSDDGSDTGTQADAGSDVGEPTTPYSAPGQVVISFDYVKQSGSASNQFAVWIEDLSGNYIQTVFATRWTANGGFDTRPDSVALWVEKSDIPFMPSYYVDAISGATPQTGEFTCVWDLTDINGNTVPPGEYMLFVEGTLRWKNYVLYSCAIEIGGAHTDFQADAEFVYAGSGNQAALTSDSPENNMIGAVTASYIPGN